MANPVPPAHRRLLVSNSSDAAGRALADFVLDIVLVGVLGASALQMGLLNALGSVAFMAAAIPVGILVDRFTPLRTLRAGLAGTLVLLAALAVLVWLEVLNVPLAMALMTIQGLASLITETSQVSAVPALINARSRQSEITRLIALLTAADQALGVVIPAAAGLLLVVVGAAPMLGLAAALSALSLLWVWHVHAAAPAGPTQRESSGQPGQKSKSWLRGFALLVGDRRLLALTLMAALCNAGLAAGAAVEAILILRHLELGTWWFGVITAVGALGGLAGAGLGPLLTGRFNPQHLTLASGLGQVVLAAVVLAAYFSKTETALALLLVHSATWGVVLVVFNISNLAWVTSLVSPGELGRLTSVRRMFTFGAVPLGSVAGGILGSTLGIWAALWAWPMLCLAGTAGYLSLMPRAARSLRAPTRDADPDDTIGKPAPDSH